MYRYAHLGEDVILINCRNVLEEIVELFLILHTANILFFYVNLRFIARKIMFIIICSMERNEIRKRSK
jgi:hypothetical protein